MHRIYIWEWSIHYGSFSAMFTPLHSSMNQELFEKHICNQSSHYENYDDAAHPSYHLKLKYLALLCQLLLTGYTAVQIKNYLKSTSVIKALWKIWMISATQWKPSNATTKSMLFTVSKDEWNTKEDTGKSLKNTLYALRYAKRYLSGWSNIKQWKNQARSLSRYRVMLDWRYQSVRQSVRRKFRGKFLKAFRADLKACLGLVLPNQYYHSVVYENWGLLSGDFLRGPCLLFGRPYYAFVLWYNI